MGNKYHISKTSGLPNICRAKSVDSCPLGGAGEHFTDKQSARLYSETKLNKEYGLKVLEKESKAPLQPTVPTVAKVAPLKIPKLSSKERLELMSDDEKAELVAKLPTSLSEAEVKHIKAFGESLVKVAEDHGINYAAKTMRTKSKVAFAMNDLEGVADSLNQYNAKLYNGLKQYPYANEYALKAWRNSMNPEMMKITANLKELSRNRKFVEAYNQSVGKGDFDAPIRLPNLKVFATNVLAKFKRSRG